MAAVRIATNVRGLAEAARESVDAQIACTPVDDSWRGAREFVRAARKADAALVIPEGLLLERICVLSPPLGGPKIVASDFLLNRPAGLRQRCIAVARRAALRRVDCFIHHFQDVSGYERYFGIGPDRSVFTPFKCNLWETVGLRDPSPDGEYVLTAGRSLRDYPTFLEAMRLCGLPGRIETPADALLKEHGSEFDQDRLPPNVSLFHEDGAMSTWADRLRRARIVAIPVQASAIRACGVSVCLDAMCMGKPVVVTEGPTTIGVFRDEVATLPPHDPGALARVLTELWNDSGRRQALAEASRRYAATVQGRDRLYRDMAAVAAAVARGGGASANLAGRFSPSAG